MQGPYRGIFWLMVFCNVVVPQTYWFEKARRSIVWMWIASVLINVGMWCERFNIIVTSLHQDFIPSNWAMYYPTWVDFSLLFGTISFFGTLFLLFLKFLPAVAVSEVKELRHELEHEWSAHSEGAKP
jgi:molybdopterin-containing oxidoreductase family membrane subunit